MIEDLLSAIVGIEGKYVFARRGWHKEGNSFSYQLDPTLDASLSVRPLTNFVVLLLQELYQCFLFCYQLHVYLITYSYH